MRSQRFRPASVLRNFIACCVCCLARFASSNPQPQACHRYWAPLCRPSAVSFAGGELFLRTSGGHFPGLPSAAIHSIEHRPSEACQVSFAGARRRERSDRSRAEASSFCGVSAAGPLLFFGTPSLVVCVVLHGLLAQILSHGHATDIGRACAGPLPCLSPERGGGSAATGAERRRAPFAAMLSSGF